MAGEALSVRDIGRMFAETIEHVGGRVNECFDDGDRIFARSTMPDVGEVGPSDRVKGGAALRGSMRGIQVCPYTFRLVCRNGMVFAQAAECWTVERLELRDPREVLAELHDAVKACASARSFKSGADAMHAARSMPVYRPAAWLMMVIGRRQFGRLDVAEILSRMETMDRFGLMNAVTSLARDTRDPEKRWRLEELGGVIAMAPDDMPRPHRGAAARGGVRV